MGMTKKIFKAGEYLFKENDQSFFFYLIVSGEVEILKLNKEGKESPLAIVGPGATVGEFAMIDRKPRSASARAKSEVVANLVTEVDYKAILADLPPWAISMMTAFVNRIRTTNAVLQRAGLMDADLTAEIEEEELKGEAN